MKKWYRLYGKDSNMQRKKAVDWQSGRFTANLIHATIFNQEHADKALEEANGMNDNMEFELREVKELQNKEWH